jgi:glycosyltransferase involved in cell wall biosynthesis
MMISVCLATKNGSRYVHEQLQSILGQLGDGDEVVISDDASTDNTLHLIRSLSDSRIRLLTHEHSLGIVANFERCLRESAGDIIFLADQDDVWTKDKVQVMLNALADYDLVMSDCIVVDHSLQPIDDAKIKKYKTRKGILQNLLRNSYMGCCMAFRREVLMKALPFPRDIPMHDIWLGLVAEMYFKVGLIQDKLLWHRRHQYNATTTGRSSQLTLRKQFVNRYKIIKNLILHRTYAR